MTHFSQAAAYANEMLMLGCTVEEAVADTVVAFELDLDAEDMLLGHLIANASELYEMI